MPPRERLLLHLAVKLAPEAAAGSRPPGGHHHSYCARGSSAVPRPQQFHRSREVGDAGGSSSKEDGGGGAASSSGGESALASRGPYASRLATRGVIRFDGADTVKFLQGLVTNDLSRFDKKPPQLSSPQPVPNQAAALHPPVYAALLSPQGRFLYDLFLYRPTHHQEKLDRTATGPGGGGQDDKPPPALVADVDAESLDELISHLKK